MSRSRSSRILGLLVLAGALVACGRPGLPGGGGGGHDAPPVEVQILGLNDFHGNLAPPAGSSGRIEGIDAGGAEYLATHVADLEATNPDNTVVVSAGDLVGASPLLSALFHDEPTVEAMNEIGLDVNAVGNHEFDEGTDELLRLQEGGCHPVDGCLDGDDFAGADFEFLAANVVSEDDGRPALPRLHGQALRGEHQGRLHRHDARGHAHDRHARGRGRVRLPRRGRHRQRGRASTSRAGGSTTSSCCCTRAA